MKKAAWMVAGMALLVLAVGGFAYLGKAGADKFSKTDKSVPEQAYQGDVAGELPLLEGVASRGQGRGRDSGAGMGRGRGGQAGHGDGLGQGRNARNNDRRAEKAGAHGLNHGLKGHKDEYGRMGRNSKSGNHGGKPGMLARKGKSEQARPRSERGRPGRADNAEDRPGVRWEPGMRPGRFMERLESKDPERHKRLNKIRDLAEEYRAADSKSRQEEIEKELRPLVEEELKIQHENNKERIERLEQRLKEMKRVMKAREENWDEVVDYTIEDITGQNEYLKAWPGSRMRHRHRPSDTPAPQDK